MCPLCGSTRTGLAFDGLSLRRCDACGLIWRPDRERVAQLYEGEFLGSAGYYDRYFERAGQWRHEARVRLRWLLEKTAGRSVLEIGCAAGFFLAEARSAGLQPVGVEPSEDGSRFAREKLHLPVTTGTLEEATPSGRFDLVCAFHVLEHVADPWAFVAQAKALLDATGVLALEVPNIDSARARHDGARWFNLVPEHHCWHFSPTTLARLLRESGFAVVSWDTIFPRTYLRRRRLLTVSGLRAYVADVRCTPVTSRAPPDAGDYLRLVARVD